MHCFSNELVESQTNHPITFSCNIKPAVIQYWCKNVDFSANLIYAKVPLSYVVIQL